MILRSDRPTLVFHSCPALHSGEPGHLSLPSFLSVISIDADECRRKPHARSARAQRRLGTFRPRREAGSIIPGRRTRSSSRKFDRGPEFAPGLHTNSGPTISSSRTSFLSGDFHCDSQPVSKPATASPSTFQCPPRASRSKKARFSLASWASVLEHSQHGQVQALYFPGGIVQSSSRAAGGV